MSQLLLIERLQQHYPRGSEEHSSLPLGGGGLAFVTPDVHVRFWAAKSESIASLQSRHTFGMSGHWPREGCAVPALQQPLTSCSTEAGTGWSRS